METYRLIRTVKKEMKLMILDEIVAATKERVAREKQLVSEAEYKEMAEQRLQEEEKGQQNPMGQKKLLMERTLSQPGLHFICEVKKASPSKGVIVEEFDYLTIAKEYEAAGASAISVLTEPKFFQGELRYLKEISEEVKIPLLRKDFIIDVYQIYQAKAMGASCVLLICAILTKEQIREYLSICDSLKLSALVEIHDEEEAELAIRAGARIVGVNNRNLKDFTVDINNSLRLRAKIPEDVLFVAESGIHTSTDIKQLYDAKVNAVLIGEAMMRSTEKTAMMKELLKEVAVRNQRI